MYQAKQKMSQPKTKAGTLGSQKAALMMVGLLHKMAGAAVALTIATTLSMPLHYMFNKLNR